MCLTVALSFLKGGNAESRVIISVILFFGGVLFLFLNGFSVVMFFGEKSEWPPSFFVVFWVVV
jgi:hypothetical protein